MNNSKDKEEKKYIYRPWITKNGQRIYAKTYGLKAFKIPVKEIVELLLLLKHKKKLLILLERLLGIKNQN